MGTFYLGLSMAGTVSAGTFTGGSLSEINTWLSAWQYARTHGVTLKAENNTKNYKTGDPITITPEEVPNHYVKIKSLSGASGGGVSAALLLAGWTCGKVDELLHKVWTSIDVREMLNNDDILNNKSIYSILNVNPIDQMAEKLLNETWGETDYAKSLDYLDENIEVFLTLASYEGIPYKVTPSKGNGVSYGIHKTHLDYIKFNFSKNGAPAPLKPNMPYAYNLIFNKDQSFKYDANWKQLIESSPATAAFPIGFRPRSLKRFLKEYNGKLFYLNFTNPSDEFDYSSLKPAWPETTNSDEMFTMEYVDGGTFNREPHDLARASLIESLGLAGKIIPHDGEKTPACVILIDPFPSNFDTEKAPGAVVKSIPNLFNQPKYLLGAMMDQGRFRPDWIEKALNDQYYSRFIISPVRYANGKMQENALAGGLLGAFSGFIDESYREHDYQLGHYNTYQFLKNNFAVPIENIEIDYVSKADEALREKYEALGWYMPKPETNAKSLCQIIPRMIEPNVINSLQLPEWPSITEEMWDEVYNLAFERAKALADAVTDFKFLDKPGDYLIWQLKLKGKVEKMLDEIAKDLRNNGLLQ